MLLESEKLKQLKIYFLFMYADGESSPSEMKYLNDIIEKEDLYESTVQEFQAFCGQMTLKCSAGNMMTVIKEIKEILGEEKHYSLSSLDRNKSAQAQTIWTLINLGYADREYSEGERKVVKYLAARWEMDPLLIAELNDTAETILALTTQKNWIQTTCRSYVEINSMIQELDRNIDAMFANVEIVISEADIA